MNKDQSWMNHMRIIDRRKLEYIKGVDKFLEFAFSDKENGVLWRCLFIDCNLSLFHNRATTWEHLMAMAY